MSESMRVNKFLACYVEKHLRGNTSVLIFAVKKKSMDSVRQLREDAKEARRKVAEAARKAREAKAALREAKRTAAAARPRRYRNRPPLPLAALKEQAAAWRAERNAEFEFQKFDGSWAVGALVGVSIDRRTGGLVLRFECADGTRADKRNMESVRRITGY